LRLSLSVKTPSLDPGGVLFLPCLKMSADEGGRRNNPAGAKPNGVRITVSVQDADVKSLSAVDPTTFPSLD